MAVQVQSENDDFHVDIHGSAEANSLVVKQAFAEVYDQVADFNRQRPLRGIRC